MSENAENSVSSVLILKVALGVTLALDFVLVVWYVGYCWLKRKNRVVQRTWSEQAIGKGTVQPDVISVPAKSKVIRDGSQVFESSSRDRSGYGAKQWTNTIDRRFNASYPNGAIFTTAATGNSLRTVPSAGRKQPKRRLYKKRLNGGADLENRYRPSNSAVVTFR